MEQNEIITALHAQLKEAAQRIFAGLDIKPGKYTPADIEKITKLSESFATWKSINFDALREAVEQAQSAFDTVNDELHLQASEKAAK